MKTKFLLFLLLMFFSVAFAANTLSEKSQELKSVNQQIKGLSSNLNQAHSKRNVLEKQLKTIEVAIGHTANVITKTNDELRIEKEKLKTLNQQHLRYQLKLQSQQAELGEQIRAAYMLGKHHYIKLLLNQQNPQSLSRLLMYYRYINLDRIKIIKQLDNTLQNLENNAADIQKQSDVYTQLFEKAQNQNLILQQHFKQRKTVLEDLNHTIDTKSQKLHLLEQNRAKLQSLINHLKHQPSVIHQPKVPFSDMRGKLAWPTRGRITEDYDYQIDSSGTIFHAVFIQAPTGQPVYAIYPGKVVFANWLSGVGQLVIIQHDNDFMSLYGHDQSILVKQGQYVERGEEIATVGQTGGIDNPGLFFQIRRDGIPINPDDWCRGTV